MKTKHKIGDVLIVSGMFYGYAGRIVKVTDLKWEGKHKVIRCEDIDGNGFVGGMNEFFKPSETPSHFPVDLYHEWLVNPQEDYESCCKKNVGNNFCPDCGSPLN